jgi:phosphatidylglycerol phospholipase C
VTQDVTLKRCFGEKTKLADCDWDYLSGLETLAEPKQHMPRLVDLLAYLAQPEHENIWVLLDIKRDDDPDELLAATALAIASIKPSRPWKDRIILGAWTGHYIDLCRKYLPGFSIAYINWSVTQASRLLRESDVGFNMLQPSLVGPSGSRFIRETRQARRNLFVWTVNKDRWMHWSIRKQVDGVITDDPKRFLDVCEQWKAGGGQTSTTPGQFQWEVSAQLMLIVFAPLLWYIARTANRRRVVPIKV